MTTVLPAQVTYGTVKGKLVKAVADTADADTYPDSVPMSGTVTFTPMAPALLSPNSAPPLTILPQPITVTLDASGAFSVDLVATDDVNLNPLNWTYGVSFNLTGQVQYQSFAMLVPGGQTTDITVAAPVPSSTGTPIVKGDPTVVNGKSGASITLTAADVGADPAGAAAGLALVLGG